MRDKIVIPYYRDSTLNPLTIKYFSTKGKLVFAHIKDKEMQLSRGESLSQLEHEFPFFIRLSHNRLVNIGAILSTRLERNARGWPYYYAVLRTEELLISRRRAKNVIWRIGK